MAGWLALLLHWERLEDRERRAGGILQNAETSADVRDVLGTRADCSAELPRAGERRVGVVEGDIRQPVRPLAAHIRHSAAVDAALRDDVVRDVRPDQRAVREPEDLLVERERFLRIAGVQLIPAPATAGRQRVGGITLVAPEAA